MTRLAAVVDTSRRVAESAGRLAKRDAIAACLRAAGPDEIEIAVAFLSGVARQGRIGIGYATLRELRGGGAAHAPTLGRSTSAHAHRVDQRQGGGRTRGCQRCSPRLRRRQDFLVRLLVGELRQGARA
jgi:DNA ligase-1